MQVQVFFAQHRLNELAAKDPSLRERQPFKAFLERDHETLHALGKQAVFEIAFAAHAGVTDEEFDAIARQWLGSAKHPKFGRLFTQCTYAPQIELLAYLREQRLQDLHRLGRRHRPDARVRRRGLRHSARAGGGLELEGTRRSAARARCN